MAYRVTGEITNEKPTQIPSSYLQGYEKVRPSNPELTDRYIAHTMIGDPAADTLMQELADLAPDEAHRHIKACIDGDKEKSRRAPEALRQFFRDIEPLPEWYHSKDVLPGCYLFHKYSDLFLTAFVVSVIIRGFSTLIAISFFTTGRVLDYGVRRLRQNLYHVLEIMLPRSLEPPGDGWKLSIRIRLVHAQMRKLVAESGRWNTAAHGLPISAAHVGYAASSFSAMMLQDAMKLGVKADPEERASFMHIWRCSAWLMGIPDAMLFKDEKDALEIVRVSLAAEPPPEEESILMAHTLINSAPSVIGIKDKTERKKLARKGHRLARAMLGNKTADMLKLPKYSTFGILPYMRAMRRLQELLQHVPLPQLRNLRAKNFGTLLDVTVLEDSGGGISYKLPDHHAADAQNTW